jgi:hypothetical protein
LVTTAEVTTQFDKTHKERVSDQEDISTWRILNAGLKSPSLQDKDEKIMQNANILVRTAFQGHCWKLI